MTEKQKDNCPICGNAANVKWINDENQKHCICKSCGTYQITRFAIDIVASMDDAWKQATSQQIKACSSNQEMIGYVFKTKPDHAESKCVRRSELPRS
jgi:hypothetical protein